MEKQAISVRRATVEDAEILITLGDETWVKATITDKSQEGMLVYSTSVFPTKHLKEQLIDPTTIFLIAEINKEPVGFAQMRSGEVLECITGPNPVEIERFYVQDDWFGKGVALQLMLACLSQARLQGFKTVWLKVWKYNERAKAFYSMWKFSEVGIYYATIGENTLDQEQKSNPAHTTSKHSPANEFEGPTSEHRILLRSV